MMLESLIDNLKNVIKQNPFFESIGVIHAFPAAIKPTRLKNEMIALGIEKIELSSCEIDSSTRAGEISVFADIFVPFRYGGARAGLVFDKLCRCFFDYNVLSIAASRLAVDEAAGAYVLKCVFTFKDKVDFGGEADE